MTMNLYYGKYSSANEKIQACQVALKLWETIIPDGNYLFYHCRMQKIYVNLAMEYATLMDSDNCISAFEKAMYHAKCFDELPGVEQKYTSSFVNLVTSDPSKYTKNYAFSNQEDVKDKMQYRRFDFVREDERFKNLIKEF